jgi:hypothetical protein
MWIHITIRYFKISQGERQKFHLSIRRQKSDWSGIAKTANIDKTGTKFNFQNVGKQKLKIAWFSENWTDFLINTQIKPKIEHVGNKWKNKLTLSPSPSAFPIPVEPTGRSYLPLLDLSIVVGFLVLGTAGMGRSWWRRPFVLWLLVSMASMVVGLEDVLARASSAPLLTTSLKIREVGRLPSDKLN